MKKVFLLTYIVFLYSYFLEGKSFIDTVELPSVNINEDRLSIHKIGSSKDVISLSSFLDPSSTNLSSIINTFSSIYIKEYGALATPSFRGTSSSHTLVLWNEIPINSIANGLADFSSIYPQYFTDVIIVKGGNSSVFGSGSIGGSIHLNSHFNNLDSNKLVFNSTIGSYGLLNRSITFLILKNNIAIKGALSILSDDNNFKYKNTTQYQSPLLTNNYGSIKSNSRNFDIQYKHNLNTIISFNYWASDLDREVPQNMTISFSDAKQFDKSNRVLLSLNHTLDSFIFKFKQAYLQEDFLYTEPIKNIYSNYLAESFISDIDFKFLYNKYLFNIGSSFIKNNLNNNNYILSNQEELKLSIFSSLQYKSNYFSLNSVIRKEWQTTFYVPLIPLIAFESKLNKYINIRAKFNQNFRSPTFNDRFWMSSGSRGNVDLRPESALNKEVGIDLGSNKKNISLTAYHLNIYDMILWQPENDIWTPNNVQEVLSRGIEISTNIIINKSSLNGKYSYVNSASQKPTTDLDYSVGRQLRYTPKHKGVAIFTHKHENTSISFTTLFTGEVVTSYSLNDNKTLDSFILMDLSLNHIFSDLPVTIQAKIKNLMNTSYVTYENYPNPGREYLINMSLSI